MPDGSEPFDRFEDIYLPRREFYDYARKYDGDLSALKLDQATLRARLDHLPEDFRALSVEVRKAIDAHNQGMALLSQKIERAPTTAPPATDLQALIALIQTNQPKRGSVSAVTLMLAGALLAVFALYVFKIRF